MQNGSDYNFIDESPLKTINYYRLKMVDRDGSFTYSPVRTVNNSGNFYVSLYPNPAKVKVQVQVESEKRMDLQVQVLSMDGKVMLLDKWTVSEGTATKSINIASLAEGSYYLKVSSGDKEQSVMKFEKL